MKREFIGIGSSKTWHGFPDALIDSAPLYYIREEGDGSDSDSESWGGKVTCEAKQSFKGNFFDQVLGHAVVSSFIHFNRHPSQNSLIPALAISGVGGEVAAVIYDCCRDVGLKLGPIQWLDVQNRCLVSEGLFLMWLLLHHRIFLMKLSERATFPTVGLRVIFDGADMLQNYTELNTFVVGQNKMEETWKQFRRSMPRDALKNRRCRNQKNQEKKVETIQSSHPTNIGNYYTVHVYVHCKT